MRFQLDLELWWLPAVSEPFEPMSAYIIPRSSASLHYRRPDFRRLTKPLRIASGLCDHNLSLWVTTLFATRRRGLVGSRLTSAATSSRPTRCCYSLCGLHSYSRRSHLNHGR